MHRLASDSELDESFSVVNALARISHWLPSQGPLKDFIHHNTLHAFQDRPFHDGIAAASEVFGAKPYLSFVEYRKALETGRIDPRHLPAGVKELELTEAAPPPGYGKSGIRAEWARKGLDLDSLVHPMLFRLVSNYLDQGISQWRMPHATDTFWNAIGRIVRESWLPLTPLSKVAWLFDGSPETAIETVLRKLVGNEALYESYLLEMLLAHPGWSGMVNSVANNPGGLLTPRAISLVDFTAVECLLELGWVERRLGKNFAPLGDGPKLPRPEALVPRKGQTLECLRVWHEAYERTLYDDVVRKLEAHNQTPKAPYPEPTAHAFFCIDDRECSMRRHLETLDPTIVTSSTAGFFGIDFLFQRADSFFPEQHCPIVLKPRHLVREVGTAPKKEKSTFWHPGSNTLFRGWLLTQTMGLGACLRLLMNVFRPGSQLPTKLTHVDPPSTELTLLRETEETNEQGYLIGYSLAEMADRVQAVLRGAGVTRHLPPLVVFVAHGASSANNPHFAAYDCGACSGRPGAPNARAFATMANKKEVRALLMERGFRIPESTYFVGALHDTTADTIEYFDRASVPATHRAALERFQATMDAALDLNAKERTRHFELVSQTLSPKDARRHVRERSASIFEPRPELNHARNAFAIVGRRDLTRGLFLDRRAFLNSYDPTQDPEGVILTGILNAVVPVCGGINLEYFFSRMDNEVYGAGTKLPHNVASLLGVSNGVDGDLRTGLPSQMIEVHEPVRLLIIVEQEPEIALLAAQRNPLVWEWIAKGWVRFACFSPSQGKVLWPAGMP